MTHNQGCRNRARGFTITETVVVVAITTAVLALLLPAMNRGRDHARTLQGLANLSEIGQTVHLFAIDNYGTLPYGYWDGTPYTSSVAIDGIETDWMVQLNHYLAGTGDNYDDLLNGPANNQMLPIFRDPNALDPNQGIHHYAGHPLLLPTKDLVDDATASRNGVPGSSFTGSTLPEQYAKNITQYRLSRFRRPREVVLAMDGLQRQDTGNSTWDTYATAFRMDSDSLNPFSAGFVPFYDPTDPLGDLIFPINAGLSDEANYVSGTTVQANIRWRQKNNTAANFLFPDGHTETKAMPDGTNNPNQPNVVQKRHIRIDR